MPELWLETLSVAAHCSADWEKMTGDHQKRFCQQCQLNVYNLSGMTRDAAEALIADSEGQLCIRFFRRADGTLLTRDCPVGLKTLHRKRFMKRFGKIAAVASMVTVAGLFYVRPASAVEPNQGNMTLGEALTPRKMEATQGGMASMKATEPKGNIPTSKKPCKLPPRPKKPVPGTSVTPPLKLSPAAEPHQVIMGKVAAPRD
ncbi:hypothetical protein [Vampirovibrio chlorellavorus]|uniref:hypothetical protein n=1 Tax=Vampirovibrio chlorellavorus TaxID=758823 RepID=UPI0026EE8EE7|nr:hypothetical protein [Vampirovibrio chlorellavorus]